MKKTYDYTDAPSNFMKCLQTACPAADHCLRYLAAANIEESTPSLVVINPKQTVPSAGEQCPCYRSTDPVNYARGFRNVMQNISVKGAAAAADTLKSLLGQRNYYYYLNGEKPLNAEKQAVIQKVLLENGATEPITFDSYEERYDWDAQ